MGWCWWCILWEWFSRDKGLLSASSSFSSSSSSSSIPSRWHSAFGRERGRRQEKVIEDEDEKEKRGSALWWWRRQRQSIPGDALGGMIEARLQAFERIRCAIMPRDGPNRKQHNQSQEHAEGNQALTPIQLRKLEHNKIQYDSRLHGEWRRLAKFLGAAQLGI